MKTKTMQYKWHMHAYERWCGWKEIHTKGRLKGSSPVIGVGSLSFKSSNHYDDNCITLIIRSLHMQNCRTGIIQWNLKNIEFRI